MAGNSQRRGAIAKGGKGPTKGSGGQQRRALSGKGPTPRAEDRPNHKAHKIAKKKAPAPSARPRRKVTGASGAAEWVAGRNAVVELLRSDVPVTGLYVAERVQSDARLKEAITLAAQLRVPMTEVARDALDELTGGAVHQGIAARIEPFRYADVADLLEAAAERGEAPLIVVLDNVTDPRNLGAVIRSAAGFGAHGVVIAERRSAQMTAAAWKTSAGAAARVRVARVTNLTRAIKDLQNAGLMAVGLAADGEVSLPDLTLGDGPLVVVIGSEGEGLSRLVAETCDQLVSIPIASGLESLNAGVAAGIALYAISQAR
jgi:23S rRNA (guanosine2251-2'-O)-methyltransferase